MLNLGVLIDLLQSLHLLGAVFWIGGMGFLTLALLPALRRSEDPLAHVVLLRGVLDGFRPVALGSSLVLLLSGLLLGLVRYGGLTEIFGVFQLLLMIFLWLLLTVVVIVSPQVEETALWRYEQEATKVPSQRQVIAVEFRRFLGRFLLWHIVILLLGFVLRLSPKGVALIIDAALLLP